MLKFGTACVLLGLFHHVLLARVGNPSLEKAFKEKDTVNVIVTMVDSPEEALNDVEITSFKNREDRIQHVYNKLQTLCTQSQESPLQLLDKECRGNGKKCRFDSLCISNQIIVREADPHTIEKLAAHPGVKEMHEEEIIELDPLLDFNLFDGDDATTFDTPQWGVNTIRAPEVWGAGVNGAGVVVANIDTGVRGTHQALSGNWRSACGWYDPNGKTTTPNDSNGHGTHTMGIIAGTTNGIGVAPGAQWIACKGCATSSCAQGDLTKCGEWCLCPSYANGTKDCSKAPHIVSNSWGGGQGATWFVPVLTAWNSAGIASFFSMGNSGPGCNTASSPGDSAKTIGVGSTTSTDAISSFSSCGSTTDGRIKPDITAPGSNVLSAYSTSDTAYATLSGTSMACPHAAGAFALVISSVTGSSDNTQAMIAMKSGCAQINQGKACSGVSSSTFPNNVYGWGRINAFQATSNYQAVMTP